MIAMSRTQRLAMIFSAIAITIGISIVLATGYTKILPGLFLGAATQDKGYTLGYSTHYPAILAVGENGTYTADAKSEKAPPFLFEWKFNDGVTLTGQTVTRSFDLPGKYFFNLTVADSTGKKVTSSELNTNVAQEIPKKEGAGNATLTH
jgi:hypothetical protein